MLYVYDSVTMMNGSSLALGKFPEPTHAHPHLPLRARINVIGIRRVAAALL